MTDDRMALIELVEKQTDRHLVREMVAFATERIMEAEIEAQNGAAKGVPSSIREAQRNGFRERDWDRRVSRITQENPRGARAAISPASSSSPADCRESVGGCDPGGLRPWHLDTVRRLCMEIDERIDAFRSRYLERGVALPVARQFGPFAPQTIPATVN